MKVPPLYVNGHQPTSHEWCDGPGANALCRKIEAAWAACGHYNVRAWVEADTLAATQGGGTRIRSVRTNLVGALPPKQGVSK